MASLQVDQSSPELLEALRDRGLDPALLNTGGGVMVLEIALTVNGIDPASTLWLTREDAWIVGLYDFAADPEDEGVTFSLLVRDPDDVGEVANRVRAIWDRIVRP